MERGIHMKNNDIFRNRNKIASALTAVASGMLTDLIYDIIAAEYFEGQIIDGTIQIIKISQYNTFEKICLIIILFSFSWVLLSYCIPLISYFINLFRHYNIPKIDSEKLLNTYKECKEKIIELQERTQNAINTNNSYIIIFSDISLLIIRLHKLFCSGKEQNKNIIKASFRSNSTVNDIDIRISLYEYIAIIDVSQNILQLSYKKMPLNIRELLDKDYINICYCINDLKQIPEELNLFH